MKNITSFTDKIEIKTLKNIVQCVSRQFLEYFYDQILNNKLAYIIERYNLFLNRYVFRSERKTTEFIQDVAEFDRHIQMGDRGLIDIEKMKNYHREWRPKPRN